MSERPAMRLQDIASCLSGYDPNALPVSQAKAFIEQIITPISATETLPLRSALGRVLARDITSPIDVPAHDNAAMDGYACNGQDLPADTDAHLRVVGDARAGTPFEGKLASGDCIRINTGAVMPMGCDTVIPIEFTTLDGATVTMLRGAVSAGDNRRLAGEDLARGEPALPVGHCLRPADLGILASLGYAEVPVVRRVRVAFFSTGNELRSVGQPLDEGCVYDSNRYTLWGMLQQLGVEVLDMGVIPDDLPQLEQAFRTAAENADIVITSGGVSVGDADFTKQVMATLGDVLFWRIAMRPGRPMSIGRIHHAGRSALLFGLPGNPVAVMVTFHAFVRDAIIRMSGAKAHSAPLLQAISTVAMRKKAGRTEFQRGIATRNADGNWEVRTTGSQGSGVLRSMSMANVLIILHHDQGNVAPGDSVEVLAFDGLL